MRDIKRVLVLGANGAMGAEVAALFAARGFQVAALARTQEKALEGLHKAREAARSDVIDRAIHCGAYEASLEKETSVADLVIECLADDLPTKSRYLEWVDRARRAETVVATVSSGLSIAELSGGRSPGFRRHFLGMHLFRPVASVVGTELIAGPETDREELGMIRAMLRKRLGRVVVECRDAPGFAGNRIAFKVLNECAQLAEVHGVVRIDYLIGPYTGRARAPLATIDALGWDVHESIVDQVFDRTSDEAHDAFRMPVYMQELLVKGHLGDKTPKLGGFYRRVVIDARKVDMVLDPKIGGYVERRATEPVAFVEQSKRLHAEGRYAEALAVLLHATGPEAELVRKVLFGYVSYALNRVGPQEVASEVGVVDGILGHGFRWAPPGVLVDLFGAKATIEAMKACGLQVPALVSGLRAGEKLSSGAGNIGRYFVAR